jgi:hypothetical protein
MPAHRQSFPKAPEGIFEAVNEEKRDPHLDQRYLDRNKTGLYEIGSTRYKVHNNRVHTYRNLGMIPSKRTLSDTRCFFKGLQCFGIIQGSKLRDANIVERSSDIWMKCPVPSLLALKNDLEKTKCVHEIILLRDETTL